MKHRQRQACGQERASPVTALNHERAAVATFLNRNRWFELPRDPEDEDAGTVRWEMDPEGDFQTQLDGSDDVRAFTCGFVVRGFDIDEGLPLDLGKAVVELDVGAEAIVPGGTP